MKYNETKKKTWAWLAEQVKLSASALYYRHVCGLLAHPSELSSKRIEQLKQDGKNLAEKRRIRNEKNASN